jgi:CoA:oxalate CoA-transferase
MTASLPGILDGVRVLDFTAMIAGPYCTRLLADLGAEVIKVEPPEGEHMRARPPLRAGRSAYFAQLNAGKKSLALDLKKPEAVALIRDLVKHCDVIVENYRPGVAKRLGLDYASVSPLNPKLVYCSISGFGQSGSWAGRSAYAPMLHAACGYDLANLDYQEGVVERPLKNGIFVGDVLGGSLAFGAIQAALYRAERTGQGDHVDLSLFEGMLSLLVYESQAAQFPQQSRRPLFQPTRAKDGFLLIAPVSQNNFADLARAVGHADWITDERFATVIKRAQNWQELMDLLDDWAATRTAEECEDILNAAGVPCSRYFTVKEAMALPPIADRSALATIDDGSGPLKVLNPAFHFDHATAHARNHVPQIGEDGAELLSRLLGCDDARLAKLAQSGVLHGKAKSVPEPVAG